MNMNKFSVNSCVYIQRKIETTTNNPSHISHRSPIFRIAGLIIETMKKKNIMILVLLFLVTYSSVYAKNTIGLTTDLPFPGSKPTPISSVNETNPIQSSSEEEPYRLVFALTAPFTSTVDNISFDQLQNFWVFGKSNEKDFPTEKILLSAETASRLATVFGSSPSNSIVIASPDRILNDVYQNNDWAILPFDQLESRYKVIHINQASPLSNTFDHNKWPLTVNIGGNENMSKEDWDSIIPANRDPNKLTTLMLTGVTAMVRGTAQYMDVWGPEYPGKNIRDVLRSADILHVNNEVPFAQVCQQTPDQLNHLVFCSKSSYMNLLKDIGTDVVELDGDHFQDFGDEAVIYTLDLYQKNKIAYYGGGYNMEDAKKPLRVDHNGNKFAFIGCNGKEIGYAAASETRPGAVHCDIPSIIKQIQSLKKDGIIPIVTFQHIEYYHISPNEDMLADFQAVADAGAVIVSGSQSHIPMAFEISKDSFIHYGLGNLFFDQAFFLPETSEATLDIHTFYAGKHIGTEVLTIKFTNLAINRFMTMEERIPVLNRIFAETKIDFDLNQREANR